MKKYIYILITIFTFSISINMVNALDITRWNACSGNTSSITNSGKCADRSSTANTNVKPKSSNIEHEETDDCGEQVPYNIVILLDVSGSMENGKKYEGAYDGVKAMFEILKNYEGTQVKLCKFGHEKFVCYSNDFKDKDYFDSMMPWIGRTKKDYYSQTGEQATNIANALRNAGDYLSSSSVYINGNAPMVILITDGYPTWDNTGNLSGTNHFNEMSSARYGYSVVKQLKSLKSKLSEAANNAGRSGQEKILTYNINKILQSDTFSKFILKPNSETLNDISKDENKEAYTLYQMINGQEVYETFAGVWNEEDYGIYRGKVSDSKKKITFNIEQTAYSDLEVKNTTKDGGFRLFFPKGTTVNNIIYKRSYDIKDTTLCSENCSSDIEDTTFATYKIKNSNVVECLNDSKCSLTITATVSNLQPSSNYSKIDISGTIVNSSFFGNANSLKDELIKNISETICNKSTTKIKDEVKKYNYDNCKDKNVTISDIYYKTTEDYYQRADKTGKVPSGTCIKVSATVNYIMTENLKFTVGGLSSISSIYAGGGFTWSGTQVKNDITARFMYLYDNDSKPVLKNITTSYYNTSGNPATVDYVGISDLYTNLSCSNQLKISDIDKKIKESINENISDISNTFETLSSNDPNNLKEKIAVNTNKAKEKLDYKTDNQDLRYITSVTYSFSLKNACISKDGLTVRYTANNCNDNEIDGGNLRYTPLKYAKSSFNVNVNGNLSSIGIKFDIQASCPVGIKQILYECTDKNCDPSKLKIAYKYRSIDTNNPFPKNVIPSNWKTFMQNTANVNRLKNSYNALNYSYTFKNDNLDKITNGSSYTSWSGIKSSGTSDFVKKYFNTNPVSGINYCPLGEFKESCNKR